MTDHSLRAFARLFAATSVSGLAEALGVPWPPPPPISVRQLMNLALVHSGVIKHVFVLILENRSFDHMLGFSAITGTDAASGQPTTIRGLTGTESDSFGGQSYPVAPSAAYAMAVPPGHEFSDVLLQLCGQASADAYLAAAAAFRGSGGPPPAYPRVDNSGFVASYVAAIAQSELSGHSPSEIMECFGSGRLPVLNRLVQEFAACDAWHASMPGPTWPNRFFAHAASSGGLDHSPSAAEMFWWEKVDGFGFKNGTIFDQLNKNNIGWRIYAGDDFPPASAVHGADFSHIHDYEDFAGDVTQPDYPAAYTFIEPNYGHFWNDFKCGTSQHPLDDVTRGETLIKATYEAIRNSPIWDSSLLIITWDEHGGFYDHVVPPSAIPPGDTVPGGAYNLYGFGFTQYGPRVPAVVISPRIERNLVDHRVYDHSSIPATLEACFGLASMTQRDATARNLMSLVTLLTPRVDTPPSLPDPVPSGVTGCDPVSFDRRATAAEPAPVRQPVPVARPQDSVDEGNLPGFLLVVLRADLALSPASQRAAIMARFAEIRTRADAVRYVTEVRPKVRAARNALSRSTPA